MLLVADFLAHSLNISNAPDLEEGRFTAALAVFPRVKFFSLDGLLLLCEGSVLLELLLDG